MKDLKKPLNKEEQLKAFKALAEGDQEAKSLLVEHNLRLVSYIVKRYEKWGMEQEDMMSVGVIGLIKAINTFNIDKGAKFSTYAARCIENELKMTFRKIQKEPAKVSLEDLVYCSKDGDELTLADTIADEVTTEDIEDRKTMACILRQALGILSARELEIIKLRFGIDCEKLKQEETANTLGISQSYVCRIEKQALEKLKEHIEHLCNN